MGEGKGKPCIQSRSPIPCQLQMSRVWACTGGAVWLYVRYSSFKSCPFEAHSLNSRARERTWVQTSSERLPLPWICTKLSLCWSQPCGAWRLLPVTAVLKTFWGGLWNRGKVSGTRMKGSPDAEKHKECFGDAMACCDIPILSGSPKMPHSRTRLGTASGGKERPEEQQSSCST